AVAGSPIAQLIARPFIDTPGMTVIEIPAGIAVLQRRISRGLIAGSSIIGNVGSLDGAGVGGQQIAIFPPEQQATVADHTRRDGSVLIGSDIPVERLGIIEAIAGGAEGRPQEPGLASLVDGKAHPGPIDDRYLAALETGMPRGT